MKTSREFVRPVGRLRVDPETVAECRELATEIAKPIQDLARTNTTVSIERAFLRLVGVDGVEGEGTEAVPIPNRVVDEVGRSVGLERGVALPFFHVVETGCGHVQTTADQIARGEVQAVWPEGIDAEIAKERATREASAAVDRIARAATDRSEKTRKLGREGVPQPHLLQRGREGWPLRGVGRAGPLRRRNAGRIQLGALTRRPLLGGDDTMCALMPTPGATRPTRLRGGAAPTLATDDALVRVHASGVCPGELDWRPHGSTTTARRGRPRSSRATRSPGSWKAVGPVVGPGGRRRGVRPHRLRRDGGDAKTWPYGRTSWHRSRPA